MSNIGYGSQGPEGGNRNQRSMQYAAECYKTENGKNVIEDLIGIQVVHQLEEGMGHLGMVKYRYYFSIVKYAFNKQRKHGGLVGQQPPYPNNQYNQPQEQSYFGNKSSYGQNPHPQEGMHFGRRMAQQINVTHDKSQYLQELNEQVRMKKEREDMEKQRRRAEEIK
ncbi:hypothetical protein HDU99_001543, partial [Rhizoclosmatium hyalinum]